MSNVTYYNAQIYTDYGTVFTYHNVAEHKIELMITYLKKHVSLTKFFLFRKQSNRQKNGVYCAYYFPETGLVWKS
jgi:hypothetical protein